MHYIYIALGGALGAVSRYAISGWVDNRMKAMFPWGTFTVNILGAFFLGLIFALALENNTISSDVKILITVGFLGAFTTFSTFSLEALTIIKEGNLSLAFLYLGISVLIGLFAVWSGFNLAQYLK